MRQLVCRVGSGPVAPALLDAKRDERLGVTPARAQLVAGSRDAHPTATRHCVEATREGEISVTRVVDPGPDADELAGGAQLVHDGGRDAEPGREALDPWRRRAGAAQALEQGVD